MNIGIVTESYGVIYDGYMTYVANLFQSLSLQGHNVYVFAPQYPQFNPNSEPRIIWIPSIHSWVTPYRISKPWAARNVFHQLFRQLRLDIVHSQIPSLMIYPAYEVSKKLGIPHVATYHTYLERYIPHYTSTVVPQVLARRLAEIYSRSACNHSNCVIVPSVAIKKVLEGDSIKTKIEYIPHGVDIETFKDANGLGIRREFGIEESDKVLIYAGRLTSEKNIQFLFKVLKRLLRDNTMNSLKMIIVGTGRHEAKIKRDCCAMGLSKAVIFAGLVKDRRRLADFYAAGDIFVFASVTEVFGLVLLEAQACGTPVVAVGEGGVCDAVKDGQGGFLTRLDVEQFTEIVRKLLLDPELRQDQSRKAREHANMFSLDTMTASLLKVYGTLIEGGQTTWSD